MLRWRTFMHPLAIAPTILLIALAILPLAVELASAGSEGRRFPQAETPAFWKGRLEDVEEAVASVKRGKRKVIARSPGGRPVHLVAYGPWTDFQRQANYNSAVGAGDPGYYARKPEGTPPVVLLIGPTHGQEMEN